MEQRVSDAEPCVLREWDSDFFGLRIGEVTELPRTPAHIDAIAGWARAHRVRGLYLFVDVTDETPARLAEAAGYNRVEERQTYLTPTGGASELVAALAHQPRAATAADLPGLKALARASHHNTRFYTDTHFDPERCDAMYERWVERNYDDPDVAVWVAGAEGDPTGYFTVHPDGVGGLMAIRPDCQRQGWGDAFLVTSLAWLERRGLDTSSNRTQSTNDGARRMFLKRGAWLVHTELVFHKWFDSSHD
ncbi:MAG: GNAT family N-acetyltransferase [Vicinamibacteraceae bacterium]